MAVARASSMRSWHIAFAWLLVAAVALAAFPPFHVRSLHTPGDTDPPAKSASDAEASARRVWQEMRAARESAVDAGTLLQALEQDPAAAERQYGRRIGYGGPAFYFVRGAGRVIEVTRKGVILEIAKHSTKVRLVSGPTFGNALRDATAFADMAEFDSFQFNALSTELNLISERRAQPRLAELARAGASLRFVGGARYIHRGSTAMLEVVLVDVERAD